MRQPLYLSSTLLLAMVFALAGNVLAGLAPPAQTAYAGPNIQVAPQPSPCKLNASRRIAPSMMLKGETADVELSTLATCAGVTNSLHIALVLDASGSMAGTPNNDMKTAAIDFVRQLDLANHPDRKVSVTQFNSAARTLCQLTNDADRVRACITRVGAAGGTAIEKAIAAGMKALRKVRFDSPGVLPSEVMIVLTDGANNAGCPSVLTSAKAAKDSGITIHGICLGAGCDAICLRSVASSMNHFYSVDAANQLGPVFTQIGATITQNVVHRMQIVEYIPESFEVLEAFTSGGGRWDITQRQITWDVDHGVPQGLSVSYRLRALSGGFHALGEGSAISFEDLNHRLGNESAPTSKVLVLGQ